MIQHLGAELVHALAGAQCLGGAFLATVLGELNAASGKPDVRAWLALAERLAQHKDLIEDSLEIITMWLRDVLVIGCDPQRVLNRDCLTALSQAAGQIGPAAFVDQIAAVDAARTALRSNTNARLTMDAMVLRMAQASS